MYHQLLINFRCLKERNHRILLDNADFEKKHPRDGHGRFLENSIEEPDENPANHQGKTTVDHLFEIVKKRKGGNKSFAVLGRVSSSYASKVKTATGIDVSNFEHGIDEAHLRHVLLRHMDEERESLQAQIPVTIEDIKNIPEILKNPDSIKESGLSADGNKAIEVIKNIGNRVVCIQEVRTGRKRLNITTIRIEKSHKKTV